MLHIHLVELRDGTGARTIAAPPAGSDRVLTVAEVVDKIYAR